MNKDNWEKEYTGTIKMTNDANDFYYKWVELDTDEGDDIQSLFETWFDADYTKKRVGIKAMKGAIFIYLMDKERD